MTSRSTLILSLLASSFTGMSVSGLVVSSARNEVEGTLIMRTMGTGTYSIRTRRDDLEWTEESRGARLAGAAVQVQPRRYTDILAEQVDAVVRREESQSPAENNSPFLRNLPWIAIAGAILVVFIISALVIWFRGRKYHGIDEPAPEGMQEVPASSSTRTGPMKVLKMSQGRVTPPRQDSLETAQYKDVVRRKLEAGDLMPSRRPQKSVEADSLLQNAVPPALATPPLPAEVPKLPPPAAPIASSASRPLPTPDLTLSSKPSARPAQFSPSPAPSTVTPPSRAMSKTPPISKITVPDEKPLPNPYAMRDSRMGSVILATPADDQHFPNPYVDSMDGHSPARADTPEPFGSFASFGPVQPLRVAKKNSTGFDSYTRTSTFDSNLYSLPVLDISSASLALSMKSTTSGPSSQNAPRTERR